MSCASKSGAKLPSLRTSLTLVPEWDRCGEAAARKWSANPAPPAKVTKPSSAAASPLTLRTADAAPRPARLQPRLVLANGRGLRRRRRSGRRERLSLLDDVDADELGR
jgi:hypothetical protein